MYTWEWREGTGCELLSGAASVIGENWGRREEIFLRNLYVNIRKDQGCLGGAAIDFDFN